MKSYHYALIIFLLPLSHSLLGSTLQPQYSAIPAHNTTPTKAQLLTVNTTKQTKMFADACSSAFNDIWKKKKEHKDKFDNLFYNSKDTASLSSQAPRSFDQYRFGLLKDAYKQLVIDLIPNDPKDKNHNVLAKEADDALDKEADDQARNFIVGQCCGSCWFWCADISTID